MSLLSGLRKLDNQAADLLPVRLIVSIAIIAAITGIVGFGLYNISIVSSENHVDHQCKELISSLNSMSTKGDYRLLNDFFDEEGSIRVKEFDLPDNLLYLSFGVDPDTNNDGKIETGLDDVGNVIFYRVEGGSKKSIWLDKSIKFREGTKLLGKWIINPFYVEQGYVIKGGGEVTLTFELVRYNDENLILIHANDKINGMYSGWFSRII